MGRERIVEEKNVSCELTYYFMKPYHISILHFPFDFIQLVEQLTLLPLQSLDNFDKLILVRLVSLDFAFERRLLVPRRADRSAQLVQLFVLLPDDLLQLVHHDFISRRFFPFAFQLLLHVAVKVFEFDQLHRDDLVDRTQFEQSRFVGLSRLLRRFVERFDFVFELLQLVVGIFEFALQDALVDFAIAEILLHFPVFQAELFQLLVFGQDVFRFLQNKKFEKGC